LGIDGVRRLGENLRRGRPSSDSQVLTPTFSIATFQDEASVYVLVSGDVDLSTAPRLTAELARAEQPDLPIVVDLEQVEFIDCAGVSALVRASARSRSLSVTPGTAQVRRLFELIGVDGLLNLRAHPVGSGRNTA
jgi:anti-anti-sigma factor